MMTNAPYCILDKGEMFCSRFDQPVASCLLSEVSYMASIRRSGQYCTMESLTHQASVFKLD